MRKMTLSENGSSGGFPSFLQVAILLAMALFGEHPSAVQWFGVAIVVAGLLLLETPVDLTKRLLGAFCSDRPAYGPTRYLTAKMS
jgi:hypothetical protein